VLQREPPRYDFSCEAEKSRRGQAQTAQLGGVQSHVGAESGVGATDLQWNGPLVFSRRN